MGSCSRLSRVSHAAPSLESYEIYIPFCAKNTNTPTFLDCYIPSTNTRHRATSIPGQDDNLVLKDFQLVPFGHHIFVIGGRLSHKLTDAMGDLAGNPRVVASVHRYDIRANTWDVCMPMANPRFNFACTINEGRIYVAGGQTCLGRARGIASTEVYDPALDQWKSLPDMSTRRYKCVGVPWQGKIYVIGGFVDDGENRGPFVMKRCSAEAYDKQRGRWEYIAGMWALDIPPYQIAAVGGKLFSSGDCFMPWKGHIDTYDEKENIWKMVAGSRCNCLSPASTVEVARHRVYMTMVPIGSRLYFLSGYKMAGGDGGLRSEVMAFDTAENGGGWQRFEPIEEQGEKEICGHCCVVRRDS